MPILASDDFLRENKKIQYKNVTPVSIELLDLWFQVQHSPFLVAVANAGQWWHLEMGLGLIFTHHNWPALATDADAAADSWYVYNSLGTKGNACMFGSQEITFVSKGKIYVTTAVSGTEYSGKAAASDLMATFVFAVAIG